MINLEEMLEFLIFSSITIFCAFSPLIVSIVAVFLSLYYSLSITISICLIYCCWLWIDRESALKGGRWSDHLRRCSIWKKWIKYFPLSLVKSADLDPKLNYIVGYHPHGLGSLGALGNFGIDGTHFSDLFPKIRPHLMLFRMQFFNPLTRDLLLGLGELFCIIKSFLVDIRGVHKTGQGKIFISCKYKYQILRFLSLKKRFFSL
jgi:hypothetical protein